MIKVKEVFCPNIYQLMMRRTDGFIPLSRELALCDTQIAASRIWTRVTNSISNDDNRNAMHDFYRLNRSTNTDRSGFKIWYILLVELSPILNRDKEDENNKKIGQKNRESRKLSYIIRSYSFVKTSMSINPRRAIVLKSGGHILLLVKQCVLNTLMLMIYFVGDSIIFL